MRYGMVKCDECGKERRSNNVDGWVHLEPMQSEQSCSWGTISFNVGEREEWHFCSPECLLKYAKKQVEEAKA